MEQLALELQSHIRQLAAAMGYICERLHSLPIVNYQDLATCAAVEQHLSGAVDLCAVLVSHAELTGPLSGEMST